MKDQIFSTYIYYANQIVNFKIIDYNPNSRRKTNKVERNFNKNIKNGQIKMIKIRKNQY